MAEGLIWTHNRDGVQAWANPIKLTCPDGSTFSIKWTDRGLYIVADTLVDGALATDLRVLPETTNSITIKAQSDA